MSLHVKYVDIFANIACACVCMLVPEENEGGSECQKSNFGEDNDVFMTTHIFCTVQLLAKLVTVFTLFFE